MAFSFLENIYQNVFLFLIWNYLVFTFKIQYNMVGWWDDDVIVPPSDGLMLILIDWE